MKTLAFQFALVIWMNWTYVDDTRAFTMNSSKNGTKSGLILVIMWAGLGLSWSSHSWSIPFYWYCPLVKNWIQSSSHVSNLKQQSVNTLMWMKVQAAQYLMYKFLFEGTEACAWKLFLIYAFLAEFS